MHRYAPLSTRTRLIAGVGVGVLAASVVTATIGAAPAVAAGSPDARFSLTWSKTLGGNGSVVALSSPGVGVFDSKGPAVLFGTRTGQLFAYHTGDGTPVGPFPISTGGIAIDSTPAVAGSGPSAKIYVGIGNSAKPSTGGIIAFSPAGKTQWFVRPKMLPTGGTAGVQTSVAVGKFATAQDVVGGSMGQLQYAVSSTGSVLPGFPWFQADSSFSSPALVDINHDGRDEIVVGGDTTSGVAYGKTYQNGGFIRIVRPTGNSGKAQPWDAVHCEYRSNQVVQSSPSVGTFLAGGGVGIVVGTGRYYSGVSDTNAVFAVNTSCGLAWKTMLDGQSLASPSIIDTDNNGSLEIVTAATHGSTATLYALDGATGRPKWTAAVNGMVFGQVTSVDIAGRRSLLVGSTGGVTVYDAATGRVTGQLTAGVGVQNTTTVTLDPGGRIGVTVVGYNGYNQGVALHYQLNGATATTISGAGRWPMFHRTATLRGSTFS